MNNNPLNVKILLEACYHFRYSQLAIIRFRQMLHIYVKLMYEKYKRVSTILPSLHIAITLHIFCSVLFYMKVLNLYICLQICSGSK